MNKHPEAFAKVKKEIVIERCKITIQRIMMYRLLMKNTLASQFALQWVKRSKFSRWFNYNKKFVKDLDFEKAFDGYYTYIRRN